MGRMKREFGCQGVGHLKGSQPSDRFEFYFRFISSRFPKEIFQFIHEFVDIFELSVDRGKPDIGDPVQAMEFFHHLFADLRTPDLPLPLLLEMEFDTVDDLLNDVDADRPLLAGLLQTVEDLETIERFSSSILFDRPRGEPPLPSRSW